MRKLPLAALAGVAAAALAGTAIAAAPRTHSIDVPLADGTTVHVEYAGSVAPKVTVAAPARAGAEGWASLPFPAFAGFDRMIDQMNRQTEAMIRQAQQMQHQRPVAAPGTAYVASFGNPPGAVSSTTVVSFSNGRSTCTRTTQSISQGPGKPPKVSSSVSGNCAAESPSPAPSAAPINRT